MITQKVTGTPSLIFANERVRLASANDNGRISWYAFVMDSRTLHSFTSPTTMLEFSEHMGLMSSSEPLTREEYITRMRPFVMRKWAERCKPGMTFEEADRAIADGHTQVRGHGLMQESTWTEFDDEVWFLAPKGVRLWDDDDGVELHKKGNGWTYEPIQEEIFRELVEMFQ